MHAGHGRVNIILCIEREKVLWHRLRMVREKRTPRHDWRSQLYPDELAEVEAFDAASDAVKLATARIGLIRNRAIQRCRYLEKIERERGA